MRLDFTLIRERWAKAAERGRAPCRVPAQPGEREGLDLQGTDQRCGASQRSTLVPAWSEPDPAETERGSGLLPKCPNSFLLQELLGLDRVKEPQGCCTEHPEMHDCFLQELGNPVLTPCLCTGWPLKIGKCFPEMSPGGSFQGSGKWGFCLDAMLHPSKPTGIFLGHKCYFHCSMSLERR